MRVSVVLVGLLVACGPRTAPVAPIASQATTEPVDDRRVRTEALVREFAHAVYTQWLISRYDDRKCPYDIFELNDVVYGAVGTGDGHDAWGRQLVIVCSAALPPGTSGIGVLSVGEDGKVDTADDIKSWELADPPYIAPVIRSLDEDELKALEQTGETGDGSKPPDPVD